MRGTKQSRYGIPFGNGVSWLKEGRILPDWDLDFVINEQCTLSLDTTANPPAMVFYNEQGEVIGSVLMGTDTKPVFPMVVRDSDGEIFEITEEMDDEGNPTGGYAFKSLGMQRGELWAGDYKPGCIESDLATVTFYPTANTAYTFDTYLPWYGNITLLSHYGPTGQEEAYPLLVDDNGKDYRVPWLFIAEGGSSQVAARLERGKSLAEKIPNFNPEQVVFQTDGGYAPAVSYDAAAGVYTLTIAGAQAGSRQSLHALYPRSGRSWYHLGRLDIDTRSVAKHTVCLVPMGGTYDRTAIGQKLNDIYGKIGIAWEAAAAFFSGCPSAGAPTANSGSQKPSP